MKFKRIVAVIATAATLALATPTIASAAETKLYTNWFGACRVLRVDWVNLGGVTHSSFYQLQSYGMKEFSTSGRILGHSWYTCSNVKPVAAT